MPEIKIDIADKKLVAIGIGAVIVIIAIVALAFGKSEKSSESEEAESSKSEIAQPVAPAPAPTTETPVPTTNTPTPTTQVPRTTTTPTVTQSYSDALKKYAGVRMQFNDAGKAEPTKFVFKNGSYMMLDNRSAKAKTVKVGPSSYSLAGYGFRIIRITATKFPSTLSVDCGAAQNVAEIIVEK